MLEYSNAFQRSVLSAGKEPSDYEMAMIIHTAGSLKAKAAAKLTDPIELQNYFNVNVTSAFVLNATFLDA